MPKPKNKVILDWWKGMEPIHKGEGDGQEMTYIYVRREPKTDTWEYALVRYFDDGEFLGVTYLSDGKANIQGRSGF